MGLLDHKKSWQFELQAPPDDCIRAFITTLKSMRLRKINWSISQGTSEEGNTLVVGTYEGRGGIPAVVTLLFGQRAQDVEQVAMGSQISFEIVEYDVETGTTRCVLWMSIRGTSLGMTADAGYYRSYMNGVAKKLATLDPRLLVAKA